MSDFDNASYSANGGGPDHARGEVRSMPFFPAPPAAPAGPPPRQQGPAGPPSPAVPLGAPTPAPPAASPSGLAQQGPPGRHSQGDEPGVPPAGAQGTDVKDPGPVPSETRGAEPPAGSAPVVKGRIKIEDEVVEKIAALAALEVPGVAALGGDVARAIESVRSRLGAGHQRGGQGIKARIRDSEVSVDVTIVVEYGSVVMEVARTVKNNVARIVSVMLGMRVTEVNVTVDDVRMPGETAPAPAEPPPAS
ncbi:Asp23/Gls24 family envelope stress response protein [Actinomadura scrupuli]|uniref:Asp23/Gls24 family envelope stress response protein n=1 Tax=Actinomadura scrupuli TaxID=559629 RepID=UPI003D98701F